VECQETSENQKSSRPMTILIFSGQSSFSGSSHLTHFHPHTASLMRVPDLSARANRPRTSRPHTPKINDCQVNKGAKYIWGSGWYSHRRRNDVSLRVCMCPTLKIIPQGEIALNPNWKTQSTRYCHVVVTVASNGSVTVMLSLYGWLPLDHRTARCGLYEPPRTCPG
jgi:hypothetical protein